MDRSKMNAPAVDAMKEVTLPGDGSPTLASVSMAGGAGAATVEWPLTAPQMGVWLDEQVTGDRARYNWGEYLRIAGPVDLPRLHEAIQHVVDTTDALRLRISAQAGTPSQQLVLHVAAELSVVDLRSSERPEEAAMGWMDRNLADPFENPDGRLFSFTLLRSAEAGWFLCAKYHHVIIDGMSAALIWQRMANAYRALVAGEKPPVNDGLSWADIQSADHAYANSPEKSRDHDYWMRSIKGLGDVPQLSTRPSASRLSGPVRRLTATVPRVQVEALRRMAQSGAAEGRLNHLLFGLLSVYLARVTATDDLAIALPRANRRTERLRHTAGMLTNVIVARIQFRPDDNLRSFLSGVSRILHEAAAHERYPYGDLVRALAPGEAGGARPFTAVLNYLPAAVGLDFAGTRAEIEMLSPGPCRGMQVLFRLGTNGEDATLQLFYPANLYGDEEAELHFERLQHVLRIAPDYLDTPFWKFPLLPPAEETKTIVTWNQTDHPYRDDTGLDQLFEEQVRRSPSQIALTDGERELTYEAVNSLADGVARKLRAQGVAVGDLVGLWDRASLETVVGLLGILKAGAAYVPLPANAPQMRLQTIVADANVRCIVSCELLDSLGFEQPVVIVPAVDNGHALAARNTGEAETPDWPAGSVLSALVDDEFRMPPGARLVCVLYTSGTTGTPKGACLTHAGVANVLLHRTQRRFEPGDFAVSPLTAPFHFDASLVQMFSPLITGGILVVPPNLESLANSAWYHRLTALTGAPSLLAHCCSLSGVPQSARVLGFGAEPIPRSLLDTLVQSATVERVVTGYGMTECTCYSTDIVVYDGRATPAAQAAMRDLAVDSGVIGRPIRNTKLYVLDSRIKPVPIGVPGELYIGGAGVARGYLNRPELTSARFVPNPFGDSPGARLYRTGDRVRWRPDGNLEFLGRFDHQVKLRGLRIELGEIESLLATHPAVSQCAVVLCEDRSRNKRLVAYYVRVDEATVGPADLTAHLCERVPGQMVPAQFVELPRLPLTSTGKVDRRALPAPDDSPAEPNAAVHPRNATEQWLSSIWSELLGVEQVGIHDNFFDLGGHSLHATMLFSRIGSRFNCRLPIAVLFLCPTVAQLAEAIELALVTLPAPGAPTTEPDALS